MPARPHGHLLTNQNEENASLAHTTEDFTRAMKTRRHQACVITRAIGYQGFAHGGYH